MLAAIYPVGANVRDLMLKEDPSNELKRLLSHLLVKHYLACSSPARLYADREVFHHYRQMGGAPYPSTSWAKEAWGSPRDLETPCSYCGKPAVFGGLVVCIQCSDVVSGLDRFMKTPGGRKFILQQIGRPGLEEIYTVLEHERQLTEGQPYKEE